MSEPVEPSVPAVLRQVRASLPDLAARAIFRLDRVVSGSGKSGHVAYLAGDGSHAAAYALAAWLPDGADALGLLDVCGACGGLGQGEDISCAPCNGSGWLVRPTAASDPRPLTVEETSRFLEPADDTSLALHNGSNPLDTDYTVRVRLDLVIRGLGAAVPQPLGTGTEPLSAQIRDRIERWRPVSGLFSEERSPSQMLEREWQGRKGADADAFARACGALLGDADPRIVSAVVEFFGAGIQIPDHGVFHATMHGDLTRWDGVEHTWSSQGWDLRAAIVRGAASRVPNPSPADIQVLQREFLRPRGARAVIAFLAQLSPDFVLSALPELLPQNEKLLDTVSRMVSYGDLPVEGTVEACVGGLGSQATREALERILKGDQRATALAHLSTL